MCKNSFIHIDCVFFCFTFVAHFLTQCISLAFSSQVSWVRRKPGETGLELLTVGLQTYSGDARYKIEFQYPNNWKLKIESASKDDEGTYECQISTYPPRVIQKNIFIIGKYDKRAIFVYVWEHVCALEMRVGEVTIYIANVFHVCIVVCVMCVLHCNFDFQSIYLYIYTTIYCFENVYSCVTPWTAVNTHVLLRKQVEREEQIELNFILYLSCSLLL